MKVKLTNNIYTFYWKIFWPIFIVIGMSSLLLIPLQDLVLNEDNQFKIVTAIFFAFILYNSYRLKFVKGDNDFLYIKNYSKKIKVPLGKLLKVNETRFPFRMINLEFKEETQFGKKIVFIPYSKWFLFGSDHPVTKELQNYIQNEKLKHE